MDIEILKKRAIDAAASDLRVQELRSVLGTSVPACLVGGAVRDFALGKQPNELDVVVEEDAREVAKTLGGSELTIHDRFMTATVTLASGDLDIATARKESYSAPGSLPEVFPASFEEDRARRDFTVNTLRIHLDDLSVVDDEASWHDLADGVLRVLHANSFIDDPTRLWRLARYSGRFGFEIEGQTLDLANKAVSAGALNSVSGSRIGSEFVRTIDAIEPDASLQAAAALGLCGSDERLAGLDLSLIAVSGLRPESVSVEASRLAALAWAGQTWFTGHWVELGLGEGLTTVAVQADRGEDLVSELAAVETPSQIDQVLSKWDPSVCLIAATKGLGAKVINWLEHDSQRRLPFSGDDLIAQGVKQGPTVGIALAAARAVMLDSNIDDHTELMRVALNAAGLADD